MTSQVVPVPAPGQFIADQQGKAYSIVLSDQTLLIDGLAATLKISGTDLCLQTQTATVRVSAQAFWYALSGGEPTATEAGLLLFDNLMRVQAIQHVTALFRQTIDQFAKMGPSPTPHYRVSPLVTQTMDAYDGSSETTVILARILGQDPSAIAAWALALGKSTTTENQKAEESKKARPEVLPGGANGQKPDGAPKDDAGNTRIQWTAELDQQITELFLASKEQSIKGRIQEIATRLQLHYNAVHGRVYGKLKLNERMPGGAKQPHQEQGPNRDDDLKEDD